MTIACLKARQAHTMCLEACIAAPEVPMHQAGCVGQSPCGTTLPETPLQQIGPSWPRHGHVSHAHALSVFIAPSHVSEHENRGEHSSQTIFDGIMIPPAYGRTLSEAICNTGEGRVQCGLLECFACHGAGEPLLHVRQQPPWPLPPQLLQRLQQSWMIGLYLQLPRDIISIRFPLGNSQAGSQSVCRDTVVVSMT